MREFVSLGRSMGKRLFIVIVEPALTTDEDKCPG